MAKFDYVIGNPPYQIDNESNGRNPSVYHLFVNEALNVSKSHSVFIIPARWYTGGIGLDQFRNQMLNDDHIIRLVDYPNTGDVFPNVDIAGGVCYFVHDKNVHGPCHVSNVINGESIESTRYLNEFPVFVRFNDAVNIVRKVLQKENKTMDTVVSPLKPFGFNTNYKPREKGIPCWFIQRVGRKFADPKDVIDTNGYLNKWKLLIPKTPIAGQTDFTKPVGLYYEGNIILAKPGECCNGSYLVAGAFDTEEELLSFKTYLLTKTVRFLLLQAVTSQDVGRNKFCFVPALPKYEGVYTDKRLCDMWDITDSEWKYIDSRIHNYETRTGKS